MDNARLAALELHRRDAGQFGEQYLADAGQMLLPTPTRGHVTMKDLIEREIVPALDGVNPNFDTEQLVMWLRDQGLIERGDDGRYRLLVDEVGITEGFAEKVAELDEASDFGHADRCPVCGDLPDYCQGHGDIGDPDGAAILARHDAGDHSLCRFCEAGV